MRIRATLDSDPPLLLTIPARESEGVLDNDTPSAPAWGLPGLLLNTEHTLTIRGQDPGENVLVDAFMNTAACNSAPCDRRRRQGKGEDEGSPSPVAAASSLPLPPASNPPPSSSTTSPASSTTLSSSSIEASSSSTPPPSPPSDLASPTSPASAPSPTTPTSQAAARHLDTVRLALGTALGLLVVAILAILAWYCYRRRRQASLLNRKRQRYDYDAEKPAPPYVASVSPSARVTLVTSTSTATSSSAPTPPVRAPSMRERSDRFSDTHTPAGTPLTRTPATPVSMLTSLSSSSMGLTQLPSLLPAKAPAPAPHLAASSLNGTSIQDDGDDPAAGFDGPPPEYESPQ
ncbi:hypothetical protein B0H11DRAFT_2231334 [Mycena galericulata]|nr:hypothetical protein B0H11DRAFT_2231334 [Mycena galericulata]